MILKPRLFRKPSLSHPFARGLVGLWLLNEGSGNKVFDLSGNGNVGTFAGTAPSWTVGKFGSAVLLPGTDEYISFGKTIGNVSAGTIIVWAKPTAFAQQGVLVGDTDHEFSMILWDDGNMYFRVGGAQEATPTGGYTDNTYHQFAVTWQGNGKPCYGYIDGVLKTTDNQQAGAAGNFFIGSRNGTQNYLNGGIDHCLYYNCFKTASEIVLLCREPSCMFERDPIELWSAATLGAAPVGMAGAMTTNTGYWGW